MAVRVLEVFKEEAITQNTAITKEKNVANFIGDHEIAGMAYSLSAGAGTVTVTVQGSFDGVTWNTAVTLLTSVVSDGAADFFTAKDLVAAYPLLKFTATEDNIGAVTGFTLLVGINSEGRA